jgi:hypothetical protein
MFFMFFGVSLMAGGIISCQGGHRRARLESYRALATRPSGDSSDKNQNGTHPEENLMASAQLSAASLLLSREDLLPCDSLPPRRLTQGDGQTAWVDGSWSQYARPFIVKGSAQSGMCSLEIRPVGQISLNPGGKDAFVRGSQIRILLTSPSGDTLIPPANHGVVTCTERDGVFQVTFDGHALGKSNISYVMNEAIPLELAPRTCMARTLDEARKPKNEWVFILPVQSVALQNNLPK